MIEGKKRRVFFFSFKTFKEQMRKKMAESWKKTKAFPAKLNQLYPMLMWIHLQAKEAGFGKKDLRKIELACEEALVNVIFHGYKGFEGKIRMEVKVQRQKQIEIIIKDQGPFFNPLSSPEKTKVQAPSEKEGGYGLILMQEYMDDIDYHRKEPSNILIMKKRHKA